MKAVRAALRLARRDALAAAGVLGLAMNVLGAFGPFIALAGIARYLVDHWVALSSEIWVRLFSFVHIEIPPLLGFALSFLLFHLGLIASALRYRNATGAPVTPTETPTENRDRLLGLLLYIPIMGSTLFMAFFKLAETSIRTSTPANSGFVTLALLLVVASPILAFSLVRPRKLMRRFLSVYVVAGGLWLLDAAALALERFGVTKSPV